MMADLLLRFSHRLPSPRLPLLSTFSSFSSPSSSLQSKPTRWPLTPRAVAVALGHRLPSKLDRFKVHAVIAKNQKDGPKWWEKNSGENMIDVHSTEEFISTLSEAGDKLVIVEFYGTWCGSCRALFPKLCKTAEEHPGIVFVKVNFDENKPMCKRLNVRVLPYFHFYRGADGQLEAFSCSLAKFQKIKDAIVTHSTERCSIGPPKGVGDIDLLNGSFTRDKPAEVSSR